MLNTPKLIADAVTEPISVEEAIQHLRLNELADVTANAAQETELALFISASRRVLEMSTGWTIHEKVYEWILDDWFAMCVKLPRATPLISIVSVKWKDSAGAELTLDPSLYIADTDSLPGRIVRGYNATWPSATLYPANPIRIRYRAGIETQSPSAQAAAHVKMGALMILTGLWENRETEAITEFRILESAALRWGAEKIIVEMMIPC